jgi:hypothetical protein
MHVATCIGSLSPSSPSDLYALLYVNEHVTHVILENLGMRDIVRGIHRRHTLRFAIRELHPSLPLRISISELLLFRFVRDRIFSDVTELHILLKIVSVAEICVAAHRSGGWPDCLITITSHSHRWGVLFTRHHT